MTIYRPLDTLHALRRCAQSMGMAIVAVEKEKNNAFVLVNDDGSHHEIGSTDELARDQVRTALMWMYQEWAEDRHLIADFSEFD